MDEEKVRVSDAEREEIVRRLNAATGEGRLTLEEFGDRAADAYTARTQGELARIVDDLPAVTPPAPSAVPVVHHNPFGSVSRGGRWRLDPHTVVSTTFGGIKLDLTGAQLSAPEVWLDVRAFMGAVKVWIPQGVRVEVEGTTYLGSRRVEEEMPTGYHHAPVLRLRIDTAVGTVKVYRR
jgi:hypothetical protein